MKSLIVFIFISFGVFIEDSSPRLKSLKIFYHDTQTNKGKDIYREFTEVEEDPYWSKPEILDIVLNIDGIGKSSDEKIEILIEELYQPTKLTQPSVFKEKQWVPHKVIYSGNTNFIKAGKIIVKNVQYKTAYFYSSLLYEKVGFRIVGIYYNIKTKKLERIEKKFDYPM